MSAGDLVRLAAIAAVVGCAEPRAPRDTACASWTEEIAPLFAARCSGCHAGAAAAAGYDTSSYLGALGPGSDALPNAIAGQADGALLATLDPGRADATHRPLSDAYALVREWVVDCRLAYDEHRVHEAGNLDPADAGFHGAMLARTGWNLRLCQQCHGADYAGGARGAGSCLSCHAAGPTACDTCHGQPPATGSHAAHAGRCDACHRVPAAVGDVGHIVDAAGEAQPRADVILSGPGAAYDPATRRCASACHGGARPAWGVAADGACGTCHGLPPSGHDAAATLCSGCHPADPARHVDGVVDVTAGGCSGCHGSDDNPAPPRSLAGETSSSAVTVGAHQSHVTARQRLRGPIACGECHVVPAATASPGHLDDGPAEVTFSGLAVADGAAPAWDRASATCGGDYCHGGGTRGARDAAPGIRRAPRWTAVDAGEAACGACHGLPPANGTHPPAASLAECAHCHPNTVDRGGQIRLSGDASKHLNGVVDTP